MKTEYKYSWHGFSELIYKSMEVLSIELVVAIICDKDNNFSVY